MSKAEKNLSVQSVELSKTEGLKAAHTPGPWRVSQSHGYPVSILAEGRIVADVLQHFNEEMIARANAEFIVRACNSHDALVEALELIAPRCDTVIDRDRGKKCGGIAVAEGSFGLKYCETHAEARERVTAGVKVAAALSLAKEAKQDDQV